LRRRNTGKRRNKPGSKYKTNEKIRATEIRVVEGLDNGIYDTSDALEQAKDLGLDLVMISEKANPPVCKVIDFRKFLYEEKKRKQEQKKKQTKVVMKEMRFTPNIGNNDFEVKKKKIIEFINEGNKVKATVFFKGRNIMFKDRGKKLLVQLADDISDIAIPESMPKLEGKRMSFILKPSKKK